MGIAMKLNQVFASVTSSKPKAETSAAKPTPVATPVVVTAGSKLTESTTKHKSGKFFEDVEAKLKEDGAALVTKVKAVIEFKIAACPENQTLSYIINLKNAPGSVFLNDGSIYLFSSLV